MSHAKKIAENAAWLVIANTAQKAVSFIAFTIIARLVGVEVTGVYFFAVSITSIFVVFQDLGLTPVVIRELAADEHRGRQALAKALRLKLVLIPITVVSTLAYAYFTGITGTTFLAVAMACYVMSADSVHLLWYGAIRGKRELRYEAAGMFVGQVVTAIVGISVAYVGYGVLGLVFALMIGSTWHVIWSVSRALKLGLYPQSGGASMATLTRAALPFALAGIFVKIYSYVDSIMLKHLHGDIDVGEYAVAYKLTYALQFLPLAFVAALYPGMSNVAQNDRKALAPLLKGSLRLMMIAAVPLAALLSSLSDIIIPVVYGPQFHGSITPLMVLPWVLVPIFLDFPIGSLLNATHRAGLKTTSMGITMIVNVVANALLIPSMGPTGASWAGVISFTILFFLGWSFARSDIDSPWLARLVLQGIGASALIWIPVRYLSPIMTPLFTVTFAVALAIVALFVFRLVLVSDVLTAMNWLRRRISPPPTEDEELHDKP
jgi:O-antigen/teichoic acid export membrane protein